MILLGTNKKPNTEFLKSSTLELNENGYVVCDPFLKTSAQNVYAAGGIVSYPYWRTGTRLTKSSWNIGMEQGSHAAWNMLNKYVPYGQVPF